MALLQGPSLGTGASSGSINNSDDLRVVWTGNVSAGFASDAGNEIKFRWAASKALFELRKLRATQSPKLPLSVRAALGATSLVLGIVTEIDSVLPLLRVKRKAVNVVTETDTAMSLARSKARALGVVSETDSTLSFGRLKTKALGIVTENDQALAIVRASTAVVRRLRSMMGLGS
jgi:hypothetical protein